MYGRSAGGPVTFLGVAWNGSREAMQDFVERHGLSFQSLVDVGGEVFGRYGVPYQPAWVFIDERGTATRVQGRLDEEALRTYIDDLVN